MPAVGLSLYRALRRCIRNYDRSGFPLLGAPGFGNSLDLPPAAALRDAFAKRQPACTHDDGFRLLRSLGDQLRFLRSADEDVHQALRGWHDAIRAGQQRHAVLGAAPRAPATVATAEALAQQLLQHLQLRRRQPQQDLILDASHAPPPPDLQEGRPSVGESLDDLARTVAAALQDRPPGASGGREASTLQERLAAISHVLFREMRLKHHPLEWVYDGLDPLLLPQVLQHRKGVPLMLAIIYAGVAHRLRVPATLLKLGGGGLPVEGAAKGIPSDLLARQAGRATISAPSPPAWLVVCTVSGGHELYVDIMQKGEVLDTSACLKRYPNIKEYTPSHHRTISLVAADLARTALTAHQRRGESDEAAHWLYVALALDPAAAEWHHFLGGRT